MLIPDPKTPHQSEPARTGRGGERRAAGHVAGIERLSVERLAGLAALILALLAIMAAVERLAADRTAAIGSGAAQARRGARHAAGIERLALRG